MRLVCEQTGLAKQGAMPPKVFCNLLAQLYGCWAAACEDKAAEDFLELNGNYGSAPGGMPFCRLGCQSEGGLADKTMGAAAIKF